MNGSADAMETLKGKLTAIMDVMDRKKKIIYIDYPLHRNIGDLLINIGTEEFFKAQDLTVKRRYNLYQLPTRFGDINQDDVFVFHGGGNLGDLYPEHLDAMESVIEQFPQHQVVQFPQTVFFNDDRQRERRCQMFKRHPQLSIFVRDTRSLAALQDCQVRNVFLMPDMAHQLYGQLSAKPTTPVDEELYFFRGDVEGGSVPAEISRHREQSVDWDDCIRRSDRLARALLSRSVTLTRILGHGIDVYPHWYHFRDNMVQSGVELISKPKVIYTNRLHAMLLALLLGREVRYFDNTYGKLSSYVDTWLQDIPSIQRIA